MRVHDKLPAEGFVSKDIERHVLVLEEVQDPKPDLIWIDEAPEELELDKIKQLVPRMSNQFSRRSKLLGNASSLLPKVVVKRPR